MLSISGRQSRNGADCHEGQEATIADLRIQL
jgi:hypothetical protein